jgi:Bacterial regulatory proteins, lacI family
MRSKGDAVRHQEAGTVRQQDSRTAQQHDGQHLRERKTTLGAVAAKAGVSLPTVSKVVNGRPDVAPATRARVQRLLDESEYSRNGPRHTGPPGSSTSYSTGSTARGRWRSCAGPAPRRYGRRRRADARRAHRRPAATLDPGRAVHRAHCERVDCHLHPPDAAGLDPMPVARRRGRERVGLEYTTGAVTCGFW